MRKQNVKIVGLYQRVFRRGLEKVIRVLNDILIQRRGGSDQNGHGGVPAPAGPSGLLPGGSDGAGIAAQHAGAQRADVHAQFQRIGGNDHVYFARPKTAFDLPALAGQIAAPIAPYPAGEAVSVPDAVLQITGQHLHLHPAFGKNDRRDTVAQ